MPSKSHRVAEKLDIQEACTTFEEDDEDNSSKYTDSPEFPNNNLDPSNRDMRSPGSAFQGNFSAFTEKSNLPFSAFNTPFLNTGIGRGLGERHLGFSFHPDADKFAEKGIYDVFENYHDQYPSWSPEDKVPISRLEIQAIFSQLREVFGFQEDSMRNMYDYFMRLLDSRASRMGPEQSLKSLHADYIGGLNSNFRKWYFASQLDVDDTIGFSNAKDNGEPTKQFVRQQGISNGVTALAESEKRWSQNMNCLSALDRVVQVALYLLIWGESNNIRFMSECLCFIFKCCNDYFYSIDFGEPSFRATDSPFLEHAITPLYKFYFEQSFELNGAEYCRRDKDHSSIIGYDDMNQLFWYRKGLERIVLSDGKYLMDLPAIERYHELNKVSWNKVFYKTYRETRTWLHLLTNFNRIWIIHVTVFWLYTSFNAPTLYTTNYRQTVDNQPQLASKLSVMALAGPIAVSINIFASLAELVFVPRKWPGAEPLFFKLNILVVLLAFLSFPTIYIFVFTNYEAFSKFNLGLAASQLGISLLSVIYFSVVPLSSLFFGSYLSKKGRQYLPGETFTNSVHHLKGSSLLSSWMLWILVFASKFVESYFFLTASLRDPIRELSNMGRRRCIGERYLGTFLCHHEPIILLALMVLSDLVMFFLDTYVWYIIWNTVFSVVSSFHIGVSIWTPWRNIFSKLPQRIISKVVAADPEAKIHGKSTVSAIWNAIVISMYKEHLISRDLVDRLVYQEVAPNSTENQGMDFKDPVFFISQEDQFMRSSLFESKSEAQRRITFFAQSLATPMPDILPTQSMPCFSVLIPHYEEKITLPLKAIIREEDEYSRVTLLEYLKALHPVEWRNFVEDTKMLVLEADNDNSYSLSASSSIKCDDLAYYCVGFKSSSPEYILRTRIWASLRSQTLYRTISGFMNYSRAIKLLYEVETRFSSEHEKDERDAIEKASMMSLRKFRIVVSMQRMDQFTPQELEDTDFILRAYPDVQIAYLEKLRIDSKLEFYSCLIDGSCEILENGARKPKYRVKLSGNPVLGDGKSDNQNHALIFCRGEYIQLIDANQDNYLEECLKVRSILSEFEENTLPADPYTRDESTKNYQNPVAIIGTREYIFSENIGVLGDVAAAKEQTFGTLFARTMAQIGGKLHYGHPDFLNVIFMTTRGGVSKAQKGLHLNEDVYAGMNALLRGGRIKHCEYIQCGKGRDLGFGSILNFTTKIGAGMGEQILSREYFYIGTQLPIDRFLSLYYAHAGFHLNNIFILISIKLILLVCVHMAVLTKDTLICDYDKNRPIRDIRRPAGCSNMIAVIRWLQNCIISISMVLGISFVPLCVQELTERGILKAATRLLKHFGSLSPVFEVFVSKIYAQSLISDMEIGGARYIATGRGFATTRVPFATLYSRFASESLYFGVMAVFILLYVSLDMWNYSLLYLWYTIIALCISPFLFNPNQFLASEFFLDYKQFLGWLSKGNSKASLENWAMFVRSHRSQFTGSKNKVNAKNDMEKRDFKKPSALNLLVSNVIPHTIFTTIVSIAFVFANSQNNSRRSEPSNTLILVGLVSVGPIIANAIVLLAFFCISVTLGPIVGLVFKKFPAVIAAICHAVCLINHILFFEVLFMAENWNFALTALGLCNTIMIQSLVFKLMVQLFLTRETKYDASNRAWWSGKWITSGIGWRILTEPVREYFCKIVEMSMFSVDFLLSHALLLLQLPLIMCPFVDQYHSLILLWLKPDEQFRPRILSKKEKKRRRETIFAYSLLLIVNVALLVSIILAPYLAFAVFEIDIIESLPDFCLAIFQPEQDYEGRKGLKNYKARFQNHH